MKLSLNETWKRCLEMWKFIVQYRKHSSSVDIYDLKEIWLMVKGYKYESLDNDCFFCEYALTHSGRVNPNDIDGGCINCPGILVDKDFNCCDYPEYDSEPEEFYKLLVKLNKKRLTKKGKINGKNKK